MSLYDPFARYYDADFRNELDDLPLYRELARRGSGPVLELMAGTGRVLVPLAEDGATITGVDLSPAMLAIARQRVAAAQLEPRATLIEGDARDLSLPERHFDLAFIAINSFMHLEAVRDQLAVLATAHRALARRGTFVLDLFNPDPHQMLREDGRLLLEREYHLDGNRVQKFVTIESDYAAQLSAVTYFYDESEPSGLLRRQTMRFTMRWFYRYELEHLLARAGFRLNQVYGSYDLEEYQSHSPRLIALATKQ